MKSGKLRFRVKIERPVAGTADAYGAVINTWQTFDTVWADVVQLFGDELVRAAQIAPEVTIRVITRYRADITEDMRINQDGRYLYPVSIIPDVRKTSSTWFCREQK